MLRLPDLAATLGLIASEGARVFYEGELADRLTRWLSDNGGLLTARDFAAHQAETVTPLRVRYRGLECCNLPPNTQGLASLSILNILEHLDIQGMESHGPKDQDFSAQLTKIIAAKPDFIFVPENYSFAALIVPQARDLGYKGPFMSLCQHITVVEFGKTIAKGTPQEIQSNPDVIKAYLGDENV